MNSHALLPSYVGIILRDGVRFFLVQRRNTNWAQGYWNFPGGLVESNESLVQAAIRETQEEVGIIVRPEDFELVHVLQVYKNDFNTQDIIGFYFATRKWQGTACNNEPEKIHGAQWFVKDNLPKHMTEHARLAIAGLMHAKVYSESGR